MSAIQRSAGNAQAPDSDGSTAELKVNSTTGKLVFREDINHRQVLTEDQTRSTAVTGLVVGKTISFTESGVAGVYTGTVTIPAGSSLLNIQFVTTVLWGAGTSATLDLGDTADSDGWFAAINLKATDLLVGEVLDISNAENWGGKQGAYLVAATGRKGRVTSGVDSGVYYGAAADVIGVVTTVGTTSSVGRSFMVVTYVIGDVTAATKV